MEMQWKCSGKAVEGQVNRSERQRQGHAAVVLALTQRRAGRWPTAAIRWPTAAIRWPTAAIHIEKVAYSCNPY